MTYIGFRDLIRTALRRKTRGLTWAQLQERLEFSYERPCPEWTRRMEREIGLSRTKGSGRALVWKLRRRTRAAQALEGESTSS